MPDGLERLRAVLAERYSIEREPGQGGMATVYLATDLKHGRRVAVKVLRPDLAFALGPARFLQEISIAARLTHPNILPLHDSGEVEGLLCYVMPFVVSETLRARLEREHQLPLEDVLRIGREVADSLEYGHREGFVHRDVKPENILLEEGHAVIADFGLARAIRASAGEQLTSAQLVLGTPTYMSPEQATGDELDGRSDVYSLGCALYEMLAGEPPLPGPPGSSWPSAEPWPRFRRTASRVWPPWVRRLVRSRPQGQWHRSAVLYFDDQSPDEGMRSAANGLSHMEAGAGAVKRRP